MTHQRPDEIPGFHLAWNLVVGVAWLLPSVMYERVHNAHHKKTTYGTADDPEYLPLAGRPGAVLRYLGFAFVVFPGLLLRFLVAAPVSWFVPPLRRLLVRSASSYVINLGYTRRMSRAERRRLFVWECVILLAWWPPVALTLAGELSWRWLAVWYAVVTAVGLVNRVRMLAAHRFASTGQPTDPTSASSPRVSTPRRGGGPAGAPGHEVPRSASPVPDAAVPQPGAAYRRLVGGPSIRSTTGRGDAVSSRPHTSYSALRRQTIRSTLERPGGQSMQCAVLLVSVVD